MKLPTAIRFASQPMDSACSVSILYGFRLWYNTRTFVIPSRTGLYCAMFRDSETCRKAYEEFSKVFSIAYQSKPCMGNEGYLVFFVVFTEGKV